MSKFLKKQVPNLKLCKRLGELGYPQDFQGFYWVEFESENLEDDVVPIFVENVNNYFILDRMYSGYSVHNLQDVIVGEKRYYETKAITKAPTILEMFAILKLINRDALNDLSTDDPDEIAKVIIEEWMNSSSMEMEKSNAVRYK